MNTANLDLVELWTRVIENAVLDVIDPEAQCAIKGESAEAFDWIMSDDDSAGTFVWACEVCDITPRTMTRIRDRVRSGAKHAA